MFRTDAIDHEEVDISLKTNYQGNCCCQILEIRRMLTKIEIERFLLGYVSWGEYPMNFAAVLNQEEIYRLILAKVSYSNQEEIYRLILAKVNFINQEEIYRLFLAKVSFINQEGICSIVLFWPS